jgi:hypothetical protein
MAIETFDGSAQSSDGPMSACSTAAGEFDPGLHPGQVVTKHELKGTFKCSGQGGMRRSQRTNSLVLTSKQPCGTYFDWWHGSIFHYTGMGLVLKRRNSAHPAREDMISER